VTEPKDDKVLSLNIVQDKDHTCMRIESRSPPNRALHGVTPRFSLLRVERDILKERIQLL
jgi:hypothetical protein